MPLSRDDNIAEAVKDAINGETFSTAFTSTRKHIVKKDLKQLGAITVTVLPRTNQRERLHRDADLENVDITILVQKHLASTAFDTQVDALKLVCEEVEDFLRADGNQGGAELVTVTREPIFDLERLAEANQYESQIVATYRIENAY